MTVRVPVVENILNANDHLAEENRARLESAGVFSINIMASPGAGKTSLIAQPRRSRGKVSTSCSTPVWSSFCPAKNGW